LATGEILETRVGSNRKPDQKAEKFAIRASRCGVWRPKIKIAKASVTVILIGTEIIHKNISHSPAAFRTGRIDYSKNSIKQARDVCDMLKCHNFLPLTA
jgi:hypothetical protein